MIFRGLLFFYLLCLSFQSFSYDSLRVEERNGKTYVVHQVEEKETLFGLSRRYNTTTTAIIKDNEGVDSGLKIGQLLYIPLQGAQTSSKIHTVKAGETLFSISRTYGVSLDDLKKWNNLSSSALSLGQKLNIGEAAGAAAKVDTETEPPKENANTHVVKAGETLYSLSKKYDIPLRKLRKYNKLKGNELSLGQVLLLSDDAKIEEVAESAKEPEVESTPEVKEQIKPAKQNPDTIYVRRKRPVKNASGFEEIVENGLAEVIENNTDTRKYLALHRSASVGTIIQVRNEDNDLRVFVRVIGKLPDTGLNENVLIKISRPAYERLGAVNQKFPVVISYVP